LIANAFHVGGIHESPLHESKTAIFFSGVYYLLEKTQTKAN
jgi:hypothetical protein